MARKTFARRLGCDSGGAGGRFSKLQPAKTARAAPGGSGSVQNGLSKASELAPLREWNLKPGCAPAVDASFSGDVYSQILGDYSCR